MVRTILVTGVGGGGSNNLIESLRVSKLPMNEYRLLGSNISAEIIAKSPLEENVILPVSTDPAYEASLLSLVETQSIDLIIPNNDREVRKISDMRGRLHDLGCRVFLPDDETISVCQDKHEMYLKLDAIDIPMATSRDLHCLEDIDAAIASIPGDKWWVRMRSGSGSKGATWVTNAKQARDWIQLWIDLRGYRLEDFTVSEFLPGRDYAFQSVWNNGELVVAKMCERLSYFFGDNRLSGMSSTPAVAKTIRDNDALDMIFRSVKALTDRPHGNFNFDLKGRADGVMCLTECNVGRFCMITPIFDRTGLHSTAEMYVRSAFGDPVDIEQAIDIDEGHYLLRELDTLPTIVHERDLDRYIMS